MARQVIGVEQLCDVDGECEGRPASGSDSLRSPEDRR